MDLNTLRAEAADEGIDMLIERRSRQFKDEAQMNAESKYRQAEQQSYRRTRWLEHYYRMQELHYSLSEEHRIKAEALEEMV